MYNVTDCQLNKQLFNIPLYIIYINSIVEQNYNHKINVKRNIPHILEIIPQLK